MKRSVQLSEFYPQPPGAIWRALTDSALLARWLMPNDFKPVLGHHFKFRTEPAPGFDGIVQCQITDIEEERLLAFTWKGGGIDTVVIFRLEPENGGTRLHLTHTGFSGWRGATLGFLLGNGWRNMLKKKLPAVLYDATADESGLAVGASDTSLLWRTLNRMWRRGSVRAARGGSWRDS